MHLKWDTCYAAVRSRDPRFDGFFVTAVHTTGIYCRPSCPATTPKPANVSFFPSSAAAQRQGFRACKRCRPEATPGSPEWNTRGDLTARAVRMIADGVVDREGVDGLATHLGYSSRHVTRMLTTELGAGPLALARAHRAQTARVLLENTDLTATEVAFAAGFGSVRQFNETMAEVFAVTPRQLRKQPTEPGHIRIRLAVRQPFAADVTLGFLGTRAIAGLERWDAVTYSRRLRLPHGTGEFAVGADLVADLKLQDLRDLTPAVQRIRRLLDLDADPVAVESALATAGLHIRTPGLRSPGSVDPHELAVRAILGQQISVAGARRAAEKLLGAAELFPTAADIAAMAPEDLPMPRSRGRALVEMCRRLTTGDLVLDAGTDRDQAYADLVAIPGIGPWTANYIRMRGLSDPDANLSTDGGVVRAARRLGLDPAAHEWRPWRSYLAHHLWNSLETA